MSGRPAGSSSGPGPDRRTPVPSSRACLARFHSRLPLSLQSLHLSGHNRGRAAQEVVIGFAVPHHPAFLGIDLFLEAAHELSAAPRIVVEHVAHEAARRVDQAKCAVIGRLDQTDLGRTEKEGEEIECLLLGEDHLSGKWLAGRHLYIPSWCGSLNWCWLAAFSGWTCTAGETRLPSPYHDGALPLATYARVAVAPNRSSIGT